MISDSLISQVPELEAKFRIFHAISEPIPVISVKTICENAQISRDTFYHHFTSKYDVIMWHGRLVQSLYLDKMGRQLGIRESYYHDFRLLAEEKDVYKIALKGMGHHTDEFLEMNLHRKETLTETLTKWCKVTIDEELAFQIDAFVVLETILVTRWLLDGATTSPEKAADLLIGMIPQRLLQALQKGCPTAL